MYHICTTRGTSLVADVEVLEPEDLRDEMKADTAQMYKNYGLRDFAAIDFETANECPSSVCSVGIETTFWEGSPDDYTRSGQSPGEKKKERGSSRSDE